MSDRFDFEQQILKCWNITDDIKEVSEHFMNYHEANFTKDRISNSLIGLSELYEIKFNKLWDLFEDVVMDLVRENKMLTEECAALRQQLQEYIDCIDHSGINVNAHIHDAPVEGQVSKEEVQAAVMKAKKRKK
jgi:hypothetical protein